MILREQEEQVIKDHVYLETSEIREKLFEILYIPHEASGVFETISTYEIAKIQIKILQQKCIEFEKQLKLYI